MPLQKISLPSDFRFETDRARKVFEHLTSEFLRDYVSKRINMDAAGWRTLMEVASKVKIPKSSFYGPSGKVGRVLAELERRGLIEVRIFSKQRGRGGAIRKLRVAYDNIIVREIVRRAVLGTSYSNRH